MKKRKKISSLLLITFYILSNVQICYAVGFSGVATLGGGGGRPGGEGEEEYSAWGDRQSSGEKCYERSYASTFSKSQAINTNMYDKIGTSLVPTNSKFPENTYIKAGTWIGVNVIESKSASWSIDHIKYREVKKKYICNYSGDESISIPKKTNCQTVSTDALNCEDIYDGSFSGGVCSYNCKTTPAQTKIVTHTVTTEETVDCGVTYTCDATHNFYNPATSKTITLNRVGTTNVEEVYVEGSTPPGGIQLTMLNNVANTLHSAAVGSVQNPSGKINYIPNDKYPYENFEEINGDGQGVNGEKGSRSGWASQNFLYHPETVCLNLKNGRVTYDKSTCENEEMQIENKEVYDNVLGINLEFWHYFVPLNAKSDSEFVLDVVKNGTEIYDAEVCANYMEKFATEPEKLNDDYRNYIIPADSSETFEGDYNIRGEHSTDWRILTRGNPTGCQISMRFKIPIAQEFYNEQDDKTFKGFNFYYKPIDVNNPFPNGIPTNSIWTQSDIDTLTGTSMETDNITYVADITDANAIRNYKDDMIEHGEYSYTRWENMYLNGISNFIENSGFVQRYANKSDIYKLGCGPANKNPTNPDGTTNYMYRQECGT